MKTSLRLLTLLALTFALLPGCFSAAEANAKNREALLERVSFDLECQEDDVALPELSRWNNDEINSYGVNGCGQKAVYVLHNGQWILNSDAVREGGQGETSK